MHETVRDATSEIRHTEMLDQTMDGYRRFQLLKLAQSSGLLVWLEENGAASAHRIVEAMRWPPHHGQMLLKALQEEGYLEALGNRLHSVLPPARLAGSRLAEVQMAWERMPAMLAANNICHAPAGPDATWRGTRNAALERNQVAGMVQAWRGIADAHRLLDLGGTDGETAMAVCSACPHLHAEVLVERGRRAVVQRKLLDAGLEQRITLFERELDSLDLQGSHDIMLAVHCFYGFPQAVLQIMESLAAHLRPGGLFVSLHGFEDGRSTVEPDAARLLERRILQARAPLHYPEAYADRISSAGFHLLRKESCLEGEQGSWLHVAERCGD